MKDQLYDMEEKLGDMEDNTVAQVVAKLIHVP